MEELRLRKFGGKVRVVEAQEAVAEAPWGQQVQSRGLRRGSQWSLYRMTGRRQPPASPSAQDCPVAVWSFKCWSQMKCGKWKDNVTVSVEQNKPQEAVRSVVGSLGTNLRRKPRSRASWRCGPASLTWVWGLCLGPYPADVAWMLQMEKSLLPGSAAPRNACRPGPDCQTVRGLGAQPAWAPGLEAAQPAPCRAPELRLCAAGWLKSWQPMPLGFINNKLLTSGKFKGLSPLTSVWVFTPQLPPSSVTSPRRPRRLLGLSVLPALMLRSVYLSQASSFADMMGSPRAFHRKK